jgi:hypothetical protein
MRQRDVEECAIALSNMTSHTTEGKDAKSVEELQVADEQDISKSAFLSFESNSEVGNYNNEVLNLTTGHTVCVTSEDLETEAVNRWSLYA